MLLSQSMVNVVILLSPLLALGATADLFITLAARHIKQNREECFGPKALTSGPNRAVHVGGYENSPVRPRQHHGPKLRDAASGTTCLRPTKAAAGKSFAST